MKLGAAPGFHLPALDGVLDGIQAEAPEEKRLETVYHDTADLRLARWGVSLRHRAREGWTLKLPMAEDGSSQALARDELEYPGGGSRVPAPALHMLAAYVRGARLEPVARLSTWRRTVRLRDAESRLVAEVVDDEVSVLEGRRVAARFREVEVELKEGGGEELLDAVVDRLRGSGAGAPDPVAKHVRALGPRAQEPPEVHAGKLQPDATAGDAVRWALAQSVEELLRNDPRVRRGGDPEAVHKARVATRRLRSHLRTFASLLDPDWASGLSDELQWLADELGRVRDLEVRHERMQKLAQRLPAGDVLHGLRIAARLEAEVAAARLALEAGFASPRYTELLERLVTAARAPELRGEIEQPASEVVPAVARATWRKLKREVDALPDDPPDAALHHIRIRAKRARYAVEAAAPISGKAAERFAKAVAGVQGVLGEHQDSVTAQEWLRGVGGAGRRAYAAGEMAALEMAAAASARSEFPAAWKAASAKSLRDWMP
ncbi:MAG: CYTH and CHAD domain-containing protein [Chloroflexota bacterium]